MWSWNLFIGKLIGKRSCRIYKLIDLLWKYTKRSIKKWHSLKRFASFAWVVVVIG